MIVNFDAFNRAEDSTLFLCNPNNNILAFIPMYDNLVIKRTFNGLSEISLNIYKYVKDKDTGLLDLDRECDCYKYIDVYRQIHVENIGYFIINTCDENSDSINPYYEVTANSCEIELNNAGLNVPDDTYQFYDTTSPSNTILGKISNLCPAWKIGTVSNDVGLRYRTFKDLNQNVYSFMSGDMGNAYECISNFDIENRTINIIDSNTEIPDTDILLTFDNVIKNVKVSKSSDTVVTALQVLGSDGLEIRNANPLGTNVIYRFDYYKYNENSKWMSQELTNAVNAWEKKISDSQATYDSLVSQIITANAELANLDGQLADLNASLVSLKRVETTASTADRQAAWAAVVAKQAQVDAKQIEVNNKNAQIASLNAQLNTLQLSLSLTNNFTVSQYIELSQYIHQSDYKDENITITPSMTYGQKQDQIKLLYNKGIKILEERAQPTLTITFDCNNFLFIPEFDKFRDQFEIGKKIHVEIEPNKIIAMAVLQYEINYDSKDLKITVSNRLKLHDEYNKTKDLNAQVSASASTITFGADKWSYPMRSGILDKLDTASKTALNITNNPLITADGQHAVFDDTGYHGFRIDPNTGTYSPKQMQLVNNVLRFTTDNWATIKAAFGEFTLPNGSTAYGFNGETIVAGKIMSPTNPYVYFDLNNGILAASRLSSSVVDHTDLFGKIGTINWTNGDVTNGFVLADDGGTIAMIARSTVDNTTTLISDNDLKIRTLNNRISFYTGSTERGSIDSTGWHGNISQVASYSDRISFATGGVERGSLDSTGWHGNFPDVHLPSGETGSVGITRSDGSKRTLHFTDGILDSFDY